MKLVAMKPRESRIAAIGLLLMVQLGAADVRLHCSMPPLANDIPAG